MRITLVISSLDAGGAERAISTMANYWAQKGEDVTILTFVSPHQPSYYKLLPRVGLVQMNLVKEFQTKVHKIFRNFPTMWRLRCYIKETQPDVVISFLTDVNVRTLLATIGLGVPVIVGERTNPARHNLGTVWPFLRRLTYPLATWMTVQTERVVGHFPAALQRKAVVIPNAVKLTAKVQKPKPNTIVAAGSLLSVKGFDVLIRAFATLAPSHPDWSLVIYGEGPERSNLEELARNQRIQLPGKTKTPGAWINEGEIFVLTSRYEGFPNVLAEAMVAGLCVISTDCDCGPSEMINHGKNGLLVPVNDVMALAAALKQMMASKNRQKFGVAAQQSAVQYDSGKIMPLWDDLLQQVIC